MGGELRKPTTSSGTPKDVKPLPNKLDTKLVGDKSDKELKPWLPIAWPNVPRPPNTVLAIANGTPITGIAVKANFPKNFKIEGKGEKSVPASPASPPTAPAPLVASTACVGVIPGIGSPNSMSTGSISAGSFSDPNPKPPASAGTSSKSSSTCPNGTAFRSLPPPLLLLAPASPGPKQINLCKPLATESQDRSTPGLVSKPSYHILSFLSSIIVSPN